MHELCRRCRVILPQLPLFDGRVCAKVFVIYAHHHIFAPKIVNALKEELASSQRGLIFTDDNSTADRVLLILSGNVYVKMTNPHVIS